MDLGLVSRQAFFQFHKAYMEEEHRPRAAASGGDFYNTQNTRIGQAFALRVFRAAKKGGCRSRKLCPDRRDMGARSRNMPGDWGYHSDEQESPLSPGFRCLHRGQERLPRIPYLPRLLG